MDSFFFLPLLFFGMAGIYFLFRSQTDATCKTAASPSAAVLVVILVVVVVVLVESRKSTAASNSSPLFSGLSSL